MPRGHHSRCTLLFALGLASSSWLGCTKPGEPSTSGGQPSGAASAAAASAASSGSSAGKAASPRSEREKIELLLRTVEASKVVFIRNGSEYTGPEAAAHLRRKWEAAGAELETARAFVEKAGSVSSTTGKPYQVKLENGTVLESRQWLLQLLAEQESAGPNAATTGDGSPASPAADASGGDPGAGASATPSAAAGTPEAVLGLLAGSRLTFLRVESDETERYDGPAMAARIRAKYALAGSPPMPVEQFVREYCSRSLLHGTSYLVELADGQRQPLGDWLLERVRGR